MGLGRWIIGGLIGGAVGAAIWVAVGRGLGFESGWVAWGIGGLVGLGVRVAAGEDDGFPPGIVATVIAILSVVGGKYLVVDGAVDSALPEFSVEDFQVDVDAEYMISELADALIDERETAGETVEMPEVEDYENATMVDYYPPEIWSECEAKWNAIPAEEQAAQIEQKQAEVNSYDPELADEFADELKSQIKKSVFLDSFGPWDLLWFFLAALTAFKLGSGLTTGE